MPPGYEKQTPLDDGLDLIERYGILNHHLDKLDADIARLLSSVFCGIGDLYNGAFKLAAKNISVAIALLTLSMMLLFAKPIVKPDVYGFLKNSCYSSFVQRARAEHLEEKLSNLLSGKLHLLMRLLSLPLLALLMYLWSMNRRRVVEFHSHRHLYGRICAVYRQDLIELQTPLSPQSKTGDRFVIVENDPFVAGRSRRRIMGEATVLLCGSSWVVCSFRSILGPTALPAAGDIALPAHIVEACVLQTEEVGFPR